MLNSYCPLRRDSEVGLMMYRIITHIFYRMGRLLFCLGLFAGVILFFISSASSLVVPEKPSAFFGIRNVWDVKYSPDGKLLAVAGNAYVFLYDANSLNLNVNYFRKSAPGFFIK